MTASERITNQIEELDDWRGEMLARLRNLILETAPDITEEWKWNTAVWAQNGLVCSIGVFKNHVKIHFFQGASLQDPNGLFNAGLDAKSMRAIDFREGDDLDESGLKDLVLAAVAYNTSGGTRK